MQEDLDLRNIFLTVDEYFLLGINLGLDDITIKVIERSHPEDANRIKMEVFQKWKNYKPNASIEDLLKALEAMQENAAAENIKRKYCGEPHPHPTHTGILQNTSFDSLIYAKIFLAVAPITQPRLPRNARQQGDCSLPMLRALLVVGIAFIIACIYHVYNYY